MSLRKVAIHLPKEMVSQYRLRYDSLIPYFFSIPPKPSEFFSSFVFQFHFFLFIFFLPFVDMQSATQEYMCIKWERIPFLFSKQRSSILHIGPTHRRIFSRSFVYFFLPLDWVLV